MYKSLFFIVVFLITYSCSPKIQIPFERTGEVEFYSGDKGVISVVSTGYADTKIKASQFAERNALENMLFKGIPNSIQENPMIANETTAYKNSKTILDDLILRNGYRKFLIDSYVETTSSNNGGHLVKQVVKFDTQALRKFLEDNNVTRKFGL